MATAGNNITNAQYNGETCDLNFELLMYKLQKYIILTEQNFYFVDYLEGTVTMNTDKHVSLLTLASLLFILVVGLIIKELTSQITPMIYTVARIN